MTPLVFLAACLGALDSPSLPAVRTQEPPDIDGSIESAWDSAAAIDTVLTQYGPERGQPMSDRTRIMFLYDDDNLYACFRLYDSTSEEMNDALSPRDDYNPGEWIALLLDPWGNGRQAFSFEINLANSQMDSRITPDGNWDYSWDAVWSSATARDDSGWVCEIAIPLSQLRFPSVPSQDWTFNIQRIITRGTQNGWLVLSETTDQLDLDNFATLSGLAGLHSTAGIEARPYAAGRGIRRRDGDTGWDDSYDVGGDLKIGLASSVVADLTVNPDFGQVEADEAQMNLSHFELFLDEHRPFFLESADVFQMPFNLFYSRRIGAVSPNGEVIPILGGAKISGAFQQGLSFGFLDALTGRVEEGGEILSPATNYGVLRLKQSFGPLTYIGLSATSVDIPSQDGLERASFRSGAVDGWLRVGGNAVLTGAAAGTWTPGGRSGQAWSLGAVSQAEGTYVETGADYIGRDFDANAAGYTGATGVWDAYCHFLRFFEPGGPFRRSHLSLHGNYSEDLDGETTGESIESYLNMSLDNGASVTPSVVREGPHFDPWEGPDGTSYPSAVSYGIEAGTDWYAPVQVGAQAIGGQYDQEGTFENYGAHISLRPGSAASIEIDGGTFRTFGARCYNWDAASWDRRGTDWRNVVARVSWLFSPDAGVRVFSQYSRFSTDFEATGTTSGDEFRVNALYSLQYRPGSMLYLLGELSTDRDGGGSWDRAEPGIFAKLTWFQAF